MASQVFNAAKKGLADGSIDLDSNTIKVALLMSNTTADTENDGKTFLADITTLDECNATGYARQTLASKAVNLDDPNDRAEFDAADVSFAGMSGDASRQIIGALIFKQVTNDSDSLLIGFVEFTTPIAATATQIDVPWNAEGILQLT